MPLEHGVLRLDSALKRDPDGFTEYYAQREARLRSLTDGKISLRLRHDSTRNGGLLAIEIEDSGPGFDFSSLSDRPAVEQKLVAIKEELATLQEGLGA